MHTSNKQSVLLCLALVASVLLLAGCSGGDIDPPEAGKSFTIGGTVTGLDGRLQLTLSGAAAQSIELQSRGETQPFEFSSARLKSGQDYEVDALSPDTLRCAPQTAKGWGVVDNADINLDIVCEPFVAISVDVVGLANATTVAVHLTYDGSTAVTPVQNGVITLGGEQRYRIGDNYQLRLADQPGNYRCDIEAASHTGDAEFSTDRQQLSGRIENDNILLTVQCRSLSGGAPAFTIGGNVTGLGEGRTLALRAQQAMPLSVTKDGPFIVDGLLLRSGTSYGLEIMPGTSADRACAITGTSNSFEVNNNGQSIDAQVDNGHVVVTFVCAPKFPLSVNVSGLGQAHSLEVSLDNGAFKTSVPDGPMTLGDNRFYANGDAYQLALTGVPADRACSITATSFTSDATIAADGQQVSGYVSDGNAVVSIDCVPKFRVGVNVSGLDEADTLEVSLDSGAVITRVANNLTVLGDDRFYANGSAYQLALTGVPANRACSITATSFTSDATIAANGQQVSGNVSNGNALVSIACVPKFNVGVHVRGLVDAHKLGVSLDNGAVESSVGNGDTTLGTNRFYANGSGYQLALTGVPSDHSCQITATSFTSNETITANGQQVTGNVSNGTVVVTIECQLITMFNVEVAVTGLGDAGALMLKLNNKDIAVTDDNHMLGSFVDNTKYQLSFTSQPENRSCKIIAATHSRDIKIADAGQRLDAYINNGPVVVTIDCELGYSIAAVVSGLGDERTLGLALNDDAAYRFVADGSHTLWSIANAHPYQLSLFQAPADRQCQITGASSGGEGIAFNGQRVDGHIVGAPEVVTIACETLTPASLGITATGLDGSRTATLRVNNGTPVTVANGARTLEQNLASGTAYQLLINSMPADRICELRYPTSGGFQVRLSGAPPTQIDGVINGSDAVVPLNCTLPYTIGVSVSGLTVGRTLGLNLSGEWLANVSNGDHLLRQAPFTNNTLFDLVFEAIPEHHSCAFTDTTNVTDVYLTEAGDYIGGRIDNGDAVIKVVCSTELPLLEGHIQGLIADGLKLSVTDLGNGRSDTITLGRNTEFFEFPGMLARPGAEYRVDIVQPPNGQLCAFRSGKTGLMDSSDIQIACGAWSSQPGLSIEQPDYITSDLALNQATGEAMLVYGYVQKDQYRSLLKSHSYDPGTKTWGEEDAVSTNATRPGIPIYDDNGEWPPVPYGFKYGNEGVQPGIDLHLNNKGDALVAWRHNFLKREYYVEAQDLWVIGSPAVKLRSMQVKRFSAVVNRWFDEPGFTYSDYYDCPTAAYGCENMDDLNQPGVVLADNGKIMLSWLQIDKAGNDHARYRFSRPKTSFWPSGNYMDTYGWATGATDQMAMAANNSGAAIAAWRWVANFNGATQVKVGQLKLRISEDGVWDNSQMIDNGGIKVTDVRVAINDQQQAVALWLRDTNLDKKFSTVEANVYSGGLWRGTLTVADAAAAQQDLIHPQVAMDKQGRALAVWLQQTSAGDNSYLTWASRYDPVQRLWLQAEQLDLPAAADKHLSISLAMNANGQAMLAWRNGSTVRIKAFAADDGGWSDDSHAFSAGGQGASPVVAIDNSGEALVLMDKEYEGASVYRFGWPE